MTTLIIQLDSATTTGEINKIMADNLQYFNTTKILDHVARRSKERINKKKFCPICGCNQLFKHNIVAFNGKWEDLGVWRVYDVIDEPGEYSCLHDHSFRVEYDREEDRLIIIS